MKRRRNPNSIAIIFFLVLIALTLFFGIQYLVNQAGEVTPESTAYLEYRDRALQITRDDVDLPVDFDASVPYGVVIDFYLDDDLTTVVAFATGDASIYFENGGGVLGGIGHANVRNAALDVVVTGARAITGLETVSETPLPKKGQVYFYLLTIDGIKFASGQANFLTQGEDPLSQLYQSAQQLTEELRLVSENIEQ